jgi:riboflavin kinase/FMN adenylyltransferase
MPGPGHLLSFGTGPFLMERYFFSLGEIPPLGKKTTLCLGNFDGVHRGHQDLILSARKIAEGDVAALLFDQNPSAFFRTGKSDSVLTSLEDKLVHFAALGVDLAYVIHVSQAFFALSPEDFLSQVIAPLQPEKIVVGTDYTYGAKAAGNLQTLSSAFPVVAVPLLEEEGRKISTQSIIKAIHLGEMEKANEALGYPYEVKGTIAHGFENGRKIGFPTANLQLTVPYALPKSGVYLGKATLRGLPYQSLINVGDNPTIGLLHHPVIEAYLSGFAGEAYGETLYLEFDSFLREEKKFASLSELQAQLESDKKALHQ